MVSPSPAIENLPGWVLMRPWPTSRAPTWSVRVPSAGIESPGAACPAAGVRPGFGYAVHGRCARQFAAGDGAGLAAAFPQVRKEPSSAVVVISGAGNSTVVLR